ncbi:hypothetical protein, partial [Clavibacter michiganensis]|uniref:hypothetical protein n=1 Tax=Clavibacter michiganensis TaxID=28447 RepID=UPI001365AA80
LVQILGGDASVADDSLCGAVDAGCACLIVFGFAHSREANQPGQGFEDENRVDGGVVFKGRAVIVASRQDVASG